MTFYHQPQILVLKTFFDNDFGFVKFKPEDLLRAYSERND